MADICLSGDDGTGEEDPTGDGDPGDGDGDPGDGDGDPGDGDGSPGDGDGSPGDGDGDGDPTCDTGLTWCGVKCVDLDEHPEHCGACNDPCDQGDVCVSGTCEFIEDCSETPCVGFSYCDLADLQCKPGCSLDSQCPAVNEACDVGTHECACAPGYKACEGEAFCVPDDTICAGDCGDGVKDAEEECDGDDLDGQDCSEHGFMGGDLGCNWDCTFNTSDCSQTACGQDYFFDFAATDADYIYGFDPLFVPGEGTVLTHDGTGGAFIRFFFDIPCDDEWHMWIRAIDHQSADSWRLSINDVTGYYHDMDCTAQPAQAEYKWRHLNYRQQFAPACQYVQDPWVLNWDAGEYTVNYVYLDSYAMSRIWLTNTDQSPP
ncbi:MAG TPA: hypothetical protein VM869_22915 [Enhygromyxa sp.]|nr:hypothetical protein [Enhygromyxa sp.]